MLFRLCARLNTPFSLRGFCSSQQQVSDLSIITPQTKPKEQVTSFQNASMPFAVEEDSLTPDQVVAYLDRYVIGQQPAKKAIAVGYRNRWRRKGLPDEIKDEIMPKNILIQGPTGCGKSQLAKRLARLTDAPFLRIEATKYTEIGYVGKDVSSIIEDKYHFKVGIRNYQVKYQKNREEKEKAKLDAIYSHLIEAMPGMLDATPEQKAKMLDEMRAGVHNQVLVTAKPIGGQQLGTHKVESWVRISRSMSEDTIELTEPEQIKKALRWVEEEGIVVIDEIDKLAVPQHFFNAGEGISTEGVQRDLLPIIEGTQINTRFGFVKTDHILFIASGSFSSARPQDLLPQLLGRLPVRVSIQSMTQAEMVRILKETDNSLLTQQIKLLGVEGVNLSFTDEAIEQICRLAYLYNLHTENIGVRRLHSLVEQILEELSFTAEDKKGQNIVIGIEDVQKIGQKEKIDTNYRKMMI